MKKISLVAVLMFSLLIVVALSGAVSAAASLTVVSPSTGTPGQTLSVTIRGTDLIGATVIGFGSGITTNNFTVDSSTRIQASITIDDGADIGPRDVSVTTPDGTVTKTDAFTVVTGLAPKLTSLSPDEGTQGEKLTVIVRGTDLMGATAVIFGSGVTVEEFNVNSSTQITAEITIDADAREGARDVSVTTASGVATMTDGFTVTQESTSGTNDGGGGLPFWVWIIVGAAAAVTVIGIILGAYAIGRKGPAKAQE